MLDLIEVSQMVIGKSVKASVCVDRMHLEDIGAVVALDHECFATPWSESSYMTELSNHSAYYIVACMEDRIVGYAGEWIIVDEAHITTIGVDPECRGQKIGERLLIALIDEAIFRGASRITLEVRRSNYVAQSLYRKYGFQSVAVRKSYYTDNNEDALVMWTDDVRDPDFLRILRAHKERLA
ncbi:MAG: ribosomal protein S18-alanine N-acetyltransferase [Armatimonadota bacterium]